MDGTGLPAVLSDPIDDLTPDKLWDMLENFLRNRKADPNNYEVEYRSSDLDDGGILTVAPSATSGAITMVAGSISWTLYCKHYINREENTYMFYNYNTDETLSDDGLSNIGHLKAYDDPMRLEFYVDEKPCRLHGPIIQIGTTDSLKKAELEVEVLASQPSEVEPGKKSVITAPLDGMTMEKLFDIMRTQALDDHGTEIPGGGVLTEQEGLASTTYMTLLMSEDGSMALKRNFGSDETLQELEAIYYHRLFGSPPRLEVWGEKQEKRDGGKQALKLVDYLIQGALKFARGDA